MTGIKRAYLYCDGADCDSHAGDGFIVETKTAAEVREIAKDELDWILRAGKDLCPDCQNPHSR